MNPNIEKAFHDYEALIAKENKPAAFYNGIYTRYENPVLTRDHIPPFWKFDLNEETNPLGLERLGVNAVMNSGAIKLNGQPLYKLAREGVTVERKARPIEIYSITYGGSPAENEYVLDVTCSKGTYIRTLLEDIAAAMGQKGTMSALRRTSAGVYTEADAHTLEEILAAKEQGMDALEALMLPVESVFESLPLLVVEPWVEQHLYNGCPTSRYPAADGRYRVRNAAGQFLGLANIVQGVLRVEKLFIERN